MVHLKIIQQLRVYKTKYCFEVQEIIHNIEIGLRVHWNDSWVKTADQRLLMFLSLLWLLKG